MTSLRRIALAALFALTFALAGFMWHEARAEVAFNPPTTVLLAASTSASFSFDVNPTSVAGPFTRLYFSLVFGPSNLFDPGESLITTVFENLAGPSLGEVEFTNTTTGPIGGHSGSVDLVSPLVGGAGFITISAGAVGSFEVTSSDSFLAIQLENAAGVRTNLVPMEFVSVTQGPAPATVALVGIALAALGWVRRRATMAAVSANDSYGLLLSRSVKGRAT